MKRSAIQKLCRFIILVLLLACFIFSYLLDITQKYRKRAKTFTTKREQITNATLPTITICFDLALKPTILKSYGISNGPYFFRNPMNKVDKPLENTTMKVIFDDSAYKTPEDFKIWAEPESTKPKILLKLGENQFRNRPEIIILKPLRTLNSGTCYNIEVGNTTFPPIIILNVIVQTGKNSLTNTVLSEKDTPSGLQLYLTPKASSKNVIFDTWPILTPFSERIEFAIDRKVSVHLQEVEWRFHKGNQNCTNGCELNRCLKWNLIAKNAKNCTLCIPVGMESLYSDLEARVCETPAESHCMLDIISELVNKIGQICLLPQMEKQYSAMMKISKMVHYSSHWNVKPKARIRLQFDSFAKIVHEEVLVYDDASMIASLGGFLGLFLGFSFYDTLCTLMEKILVYFWIIR